MIEAKLFLGASKKALELGVSEERDWDYVSAPLLSHVDCEMTFRDVEWEVVFVTIGVFLSQAGAAFQDLLEDCCLWEFVVFLDGHCGFERERR